MPAARRMQTESSFSVLRTEIAGVSVSELAREFGTPVYVYDAAKIVERIDDLRQFDVIRYAQKACSNLAILDLVRRQGCWSMRSARAKSTGHWRPATRSQGEPPPIVYTADIFDRESLDLVVEHGHPRQLRLARHDRPARRAGPRPQHHAADQSRLRPRPQPEDEHRRRAIEARHLARAARRLPAPGRSSRPGRSPACTCTSARAPIWSTCAGLRRDGRTAREVGRSLTTISAGGGLPVPYRAEQTYVDLAAYYRALGRDAQTAGRRVRPQAHAGDRAGPLPGRRKRLSGQRDSRHQANGRQHVLSARRRLQQSRPADSVRRVSSDVDRARGRRRRTIERCRTSSSAARCANRATSSRRKKGASSARASCPPPASASTW